MDEARLVEFEQAAVQLMVRNLHKSRLFFNAHDTVVSAVRSVSWRQEEGWNGVSRAQKDAATLRDMQEYPW